MTQDEAKQLAYGEILHHNRNGGCLRWKVNGRVMTWKRTPNFMVPLKHGLYDFFHMTQANCDEFHKERFCIYKEGC